MSNFNLTTGVEKATRWITLEKVVRLTYRNVSERDGVSGKRFSVAEDALLQFNAPPWLVTAVR